MLEPASRARTSFEDAFELALADCVNVILILEQHAERVFDDGQIKLVRVERHQRLGPVERLGDAGHFVEFHPAQALDELDQLAGQALGAFGTRSVTMRYSFSGVG